MSTEAIYNIHVEIIAVHWAICESFNFEILIVDPAINRHRDIRLTMEISGATVDGGIYDPNGELLQSFTHTIQDSTAIMITYG